MKYRLKFELISIDGVLFHQGEEVFSTLTETVTKRNGKVTTYMNLKRKSDGKEIARVDSKHLVPVRKTI